jgi:transposase
MDGKIEQCVFIKFCLKLGKSATETLEMLHEAFGEHSLSWIVVFQWHSRFKAGRVSAEDDERSGRPNTIKTTENIEKILELIHEDHRRTIHELRHCWDQLWSLPEDLNRNLNMHLIASKFVPQLFDK